MEYRGSACLGQPEAVQRCNCGGAACKSAKVGDKAFSGLGSREPGSGAQVRVQVQDLNFTRHPRLFLNTRARDLRAETWDLKMALTFAPLHSPQADLHFCT